MWEKGRDWQTTGLYGKFWQRIEKDNGNIAFISYQVMAKFVSPALRTIFPNAELLFLAVLGLLLAALTVVVPRFFGRYVDRRLLVLSRAAAGWRGRTWILRGSARISGRSTRCWELFIK